MRLTPLVALLLASLLASLPVAAGNRVSCVQNGVGLPDCVLAEGAPENFAATYEPATQVLSLTWTAPSGVVPDSYVVYRDDVAWATPIGLTVDDDLTGYEGIHAYRVEAVVGGIAGDSTWPLYVAKTGSGCVGISGSIPPAIPPIYIHPDNCP